MKATSKLKSNSKLNNKDHKVAAWLHSHDWDFSQNTQQGNQNYHWNSKGELIARLTFNNSECTYTVETI